MSKGPGVVERKIDELFMASGYHGRDDRSWTVPELCRAVFGTDTTTRAQKVSVVRAARTAMRRSQAIVRAAKAAEPDTLFPSWILAYWRATAMPDGSLVFHHVLRPARVWAVSVTREGVSWHETEIVKITPTRISVVYQGVRCPLHRPSFYPYGSWWREVLFVSERDGLTVEWLDERWREQFGHLFTAATMPMALQRARQLLGMPDNTYYDRDTVIAAFRKAAKRCHPDLGGTAEAFRLLIEARDRLLAALGAPIPKAPTFKAVGQTRYVTMGSYSRRSRLLSGGSRKLLAG